MVVLVSENQEEVNGSHKTSANHVLCVFKPWSFFQILDITCTVRVENSAMFSRLMVFVYSLC